MQECSSPACAMTKSAAVDTDDEHHAMAAAPVGETVKDRSQRKRSDPRRSHGRPVRRIPAWDSGRRAPPTPRSRECLPQRRGSRIRSFRPAAWIRAAMKSATATGVREETVIFAVAIGLARDVPFADTIGIDRGPGSSLSRGTGTARGKDRVSSPGRGRGCSTATFIPAFRSRLPARSASGATRDGRRDPTQSA